jgi:RNA polymerase sigma-70 factor (ECF subfamily)
VNDGETLVAEIPRLRRYARALTGNGDRADDLVQDTLERALAKWSLWQRGRALRPWLFAIMHNLYVQQVRSPGPVDYRSDDELPVASQRPSDNLEIRDLDRALALLPVEQREVVLLVGLEDMSYAEAARALSVPAGTVMSRLARGRERLRTVLARDNQPALKIVK